MFHGAAARGTYQNQCFFFCLLSLVGSGLIFSWSLRLRNTGRRAQLWHGLDERGTVLLFHIVIYCPVLCLCFSCASLPKGRKSQGLQHNPASCSASFCLCAFLRFALSRWKTLGSFRYFLERGRRPAFVRLALRALGESPVQNPGLDRPRSPPEIPRGNNGRCKEDGKVERKQGLAQISANSMACRCPKPDGCVASSSLQACFVCLLREKLKSWK